jgi:hypothetical protein
LNRSRNLSLSFGSSSDNDLLSDTYLVLDAKVKDNGTLVLDSLLRLGIIQQVLQELDEVPKEKTVIFTMLARYFMN